MPGDDRLRQAIRLGVLPSSFNRRNSVSSRDKDDLYSFTLSEPRSSVDIALSGLRARTNVALEVFQLKGRKQQVLRRIGGIDFGRLTTRQRNQSIRSIVRSDRGGNLSESINRNFDAGEYYLRVQYRSGRNRVNYRISGTVNPDAAGESRDTARLITTGNTLFNDFVGTSDSSDYYRFNVAQFGTTTVSLNNLSADANVRLLDTAGNQIAASGNGGTTPETITANLARGDYFLEVTPVAGASTTYQIGVNSTAFPDGGGNTPEAATPITVDFTRRFLTDLVSEDDQNDYYSFNLEYAAKFELSLTGLAANADVRLINALDRTERAISVNPGNADELILIEPIDPTSSTPFPVLEAGSYLIQVSSAGAGQNTPYRLEYYALPAVDLAGNTPTPGVARDITASLNNTSITNRAQFVDFVGGVDDNDYYTFAVPDGGKFVSVELNIPIAGANVNADVQLLKAEGDTLELIASSNRAGNNQEAFGGNLASGTYYLRVFPGASDQGAFYNLRMYSRDANGVPSIARDINPGDAPSSPDQLTVVGDTKVFFVANDGTGQTLWQADGSIDPTDIGTLQSIKKADLGIGLTGIGNLVSGEFNGAPALYFTADAPGIGLALWRSDGTAQGTQALLSVDAINASGFQGKPVNVDGTMYFLTTSSVTLTFSTLWRTDGSVAGTTQIDLPDDAEERVLRQLTAINSSLFFSADTIQNGRELWRLDNTSVAAEIIDVNTQPYSDGSGRTAGSSPRDFIGFNNAVYFVASISDEFGIPTTGEELWKYDLSSRSVTQLTEYAGSDGSDNSASFFDGDPNFTIFNSTLYFTANTPLGKELLRLNSAGTVEFVADINTAPGQGSDPGNLTVVGSGATASLYFTANDGTGQKLWRYSGTGTPTAVNINPVVDDDPDTQNLIDISGTLYFSADGGNGTGTELWKIDATGALQQLPEFDILLGAESSNPAQFVEVLGRLFFVANNGNETVAGNGQELWVI